MRKPPEKLILVQCADCGFKRLDLSNHTSVVIEPAKDCNSTRLESTEYRVHRPEVAAIGSIPRFDHGSQHDGPTFDPNDGVGGRL